MIDRYTFLDCNGWYTSLDKYVSGARGAAVNRLAEYENTGLEPKEIVKLKAERDAAVQDIEELIFELRGSSYCERNSKCGTEVCYLRNDGNSCRPKWRGPQQEET